MPSYLLGLDAGSTMTKAVLFDLQGREIGAERRRNPILFPHPGHTERDPMRMWRDAADAIRALLAATGIDPADVQAIAPSGYGAGLYVVDGQRRPVRMGVMSTDARAAGILDEWAQGGLAERTGAMVQQRHWTGQAAAVMAWLQRHESQVVADGHTLMFCKDFLRSQLSGDCSTDFTDAGLAGLIDVPSGQWQLGFLEALGLQRWAGMLPPLGDGCERTGTLGAEAAAATGLRQGLAVVRGLVDVVAAAVATGVARPDQLSVVAGTFSINSTLHPLHAPRMHHLPLLQTPYPIGRQCLATEGAPTSASNFEWYCKSVLGPVLVAAAEAGGRSIYEMLGWQAERAMARPNDILFFPFLFGGPGAAPAGFVGLQAAHDGSDLVRAIFEGIAFAHKLDVDALRLGRDAAPVSCIRLTGGAARSHTWSQMFADVLGLPVEVTDVSEAGALGTAMAAAVGVGIYPDLARAQTQMVRVLRRHEPRPDWQAMYERKFARFQRHVEVLAALQQENH